MAHSLLVPVISGCGGGQTGQILDKFAFTVLPFANVVDPVIGTGVLTVLAAGIGTVLAGRNRTRAETEAERVQRRMTVQQEVEAIAAEYHAILPS